MSIRRELQSVDWEKLFCGLSAELSWLLFKDYLELLQHKFIPMVNRSRKSDKPIWMTHKALKAVKHRRLIYNKYKDSSHPAYGMSKLLNRPVSSSDSPDKISRSC